MTVTGNDGSGVKSWYRQQPWFSHSPEDDVVCVEKPWGWRGMCGTALRMTWYVWHSPEDDVVCVAQPWGWRGMCGKAV